MRRHEILPHGLVGVKTDVLHPQRRENLVPEIIIEGRAGDPLDDYARPVYTDLSLNDQHHSRLNKS